MKSQIAKRVLLLSSLAALGCEPAEQAVTIVAEDYRFTPVEIRLSSDRPIRLSVVNEGREPHEFKSPILAHRIRTADRLADSLRVSVNQRVEAVIRTVPGIYVFYCGVRGHAGMSGTIVVE